MKHIFKIIVYITCYILLFYLFALKVPVLLKKTIPSIETNKNIELTDLIAEILVGTIVLLPVYYYRRQYIRISSKLNIKRLLLYILAVLVADYLTHSLFIYHTFEINFVFRFDNTVLLKWFFLFLKNYYYKCNHFRIVMQRNFNRILINKKDKTYLDCVAFSLSFWVYLFILLR